MTICIACVYIPSFELQARARHQPLWRSAEPAVVVSSGKRAQVISLNRAARQSGVRREMSLQQAQSLTPDVHWEIWRRRHQREAFESLAALFERFSPRVEVLEGALGCFWLDCRGLVPLFSSMKSWRTALVQTLSSAGWVARIALGETPFDAMVLARSSTQGQDTVCLLSSSINVLGLASSARLHCRALGIETLGQLAQIPSAERRQVFGRHILIGSAWCRGPWHHRRALVEPRGDVQLSWSNQEVIERQCDLLAVCEYLFERALIVAQRRVLEPVRCTWRGRNVIVDSPDPVVCIQVPGTSTSWSFWQRLLTLRLQQAPWESVQSLELVMELGVPSPVQASLEWNVSAQKKGARHRDDYVDRLQQALLELQSLHGESCVSVLKSEANLVPERRHNRGAWHPISTLTRGAGHHPVRVRALGTPVFIQPMKACRFGELCALPWWDGASRRRYGEVTRAERDALWVYVEQQTGRWYCVGWG